MRRLMKKVVSVFISLLILFGNVFVLPMNAFAEETPEETETKNVRIYTAVASNWNDNWGNYFISYKLKNEEGVSNSIYYSEVKIIKKFTWKK